MIELRFPIPLDTPKGRGLAYFVSDFGCDHSLMWTVAIDESGECWTFPNEQIRFVKNITMGRRIQKC